MATVYRKTVTREIPKDAERFTKKGIEFVRFKAKGKTKSAKVVIGNGGQQRMSLSVGTYIIKFRDHLGIVHEKPTGCRDEGAARNMLAEIVRREELLLSKIITQSEVNQAEQQRLPTVEHLEFYLQSMRSAGRSQNHIADMKQKVHRLVQECEFSRLVDINREGMENWLVGCTQEGMAPRTRNAYLQAIRSFLNWCIPDRLNSNPLARVEKADENIDRRKQRRSMTQDELSRLLRVAMFRPLAECGRKIIGGESQQGKKKRTCWTYEPLRFDDLEACCEQARERLSKRPDFIAELVERGRERMLTYKTLVLTGLRCNELRSIAVAQVYVEGDRPYIELLPEDEKNRKGSSLPLSSELATELAEWIAETSGRAVDGVLAIKKDIRKRPLFSAPSGLLKILDRDLIVAGIEKEDSRGRTLDVHALRTTFGTMLSMAGVAPRTAQAAMRHSRIDLTMNIYTDPTLLDVAGAIGSLPNVRPSNPRPSDSLKATGTETRSPTVAPTVAPATVKTCQTMSLNGKNPAKVDFGFEGSKNEKTLEITRENQGFCKRGRRGSNPQPPDRQSGALTN